MTAAPDTSAIISPCGAYRYTLSRGWGLTTLARSNGILTVVMLNPSTADATKNDPTIRRVMDFAFGHLFAGIRVLNLFALRATNPDELLHHPDPVGPHNDQHLRAALAAAVDADRPVLAAWGAYAGKKWSAIDRADQVMALVPGVRWVCLGTTKHGSPRHPLYVRSTQPMVPFAMGSVDAAKEPTP